MPNGSAPTRFRPAPAPRLAAGQRSGRGKAAPPTLLPGHPLRPPLARRCIVRKTRIPLCEHMSSARMPSWNCGRRIADFPVGWRCLISRRLGLAQPLPVWKPAIRQVWKPAPPPRSAAQRRNRTVPPTFAMRLPVGSAALNPEGIAPISPGLRGTSYPGEDREGTAYPERVASRRDQRTGNGRNPFRVDGLRRRLTQGSSCLATLG